MEIRPEASSDFEGALSSILGPIISHAGLIAFAALPLAAGVGLLKVGSQFEDAFHHIQQMTGATGLQLLSLGKSFNQVFANTPGANFTNTADAIGLVNVKTGLAGSALDDLSSKFIELGKITGTDVKADITASLGVFDQFGVKVQDQSGQLDVLYKAARDAGVGYDTFAATLKQVAPTAQSLGLSLDQTAALTSNLTKLGLPASKIMLGLGTAFAKAAKAGKDPTTVISDLIGEIQKAPNPTAATELAITKFGLSARSAATFVDSVRAGSFKFGATLKDITGGKGGINETAVATESLGDKFNLLKNKALVALEPIAMKVIDFANTIADKLPGIFNVIGKAWDDILVGFKDPKGKASSGISAFAKFFFDLGQTISQVVSTMKADWEKFYPIFETKILPKLKEFGEFIEAHLKPILIGLGIAIGLIAAPVLTVVAGFIYAYTHFKTFRDVVQDIVKWLVGTAIPDLIKFGKGVIDVITDVAKWWDVHWHEIKNVVEPIVNFIGALINDMIHILNSGFDFFGSLVTGKWGKAWGDVKDVVSHAWDLVKSAVVDGIKVVWQLVQDFGPMIVKAINDHLVQPFWNKIQDMWSVVEKTFVDAPGKLLTALGDGLQLLVKWGGDILQGLINGIESAIKGSGIGKVVGDIKDAITGGLKHLFGIGSPSKVTYQYGTWIVEGMANGIAESTHLVANALGKLPGFSVGAALGGPAGLNITVPGAAKPGSSVATPPGGTLADKADKTNDLLGQLVQLTKMPPQSGLAPGATWTTPSGQNPVPPQGVARAQMRTLAATRQR